VFEVATGRLTNLTDDGVTGSLFSPEGAQPLLTDLFPAWSPDGQELAFARTVLEEDGGTTSGIFRVSATGGEPKPVAPLPEPGAFAIFPELRWSADGNVIGYSLLMPNWDDPNNGLWVVEADGTNQRQLLTDSKLARPLLIDLSARGIAFIADADYLENPEGYTGHPFAVVDLATGEEDSLDALPPPMWGSPRLPMLVFSPDGKLLLFVTIAPSGDQRLMLYDFDRRETSTLIDSVESWNGGAEPSGMAWADNGDVFVPGPQGNGILLPLEHDVP
jgi:dipeptidyl aminopeptidase/acylaminoacyl peptidase